MQNTKSSAIDQLRDLKGRVETYGKRRAELERLKSEMESSGDFTLGDSELGLYSHTAAGVQLAAAQDKPVRVAIAKGLQTAASALSAGIGRVQNCHRDIDAEIQKLVVATLPDELKGVQVVTGPMEVNITDAFVRKVDIPGQLHIRQSKLGKAEFAVRFDPVNVSAQGYFDPVAPLDKVLQIVDQMIRAVEKVDAEEARCARALQDLRKAA